MIIFKKVRAKNFLSVGNSYFEIDLNKSPLTCIKGVNSAGKCVDYLTTITIKNKKTDEVSKELIGEFYDKVCNDSNYSHVDFSGNITNQGNKPSEIVSRKFVDTIELEEWQIETDSGWQDISFIHKTLPYQKWLIKTENELELTCADDHIVFDEYFNEIFVKDLKVDISSIQTKYGVSKIILVQKLESEENMYDVSVDSEDHRFYSNNILSHNSTFIDALTFVLYKKPYRNINLPQLVNNVNKKDCVAEVEFVIGNNEWKIKRGLSPNIFEIYKDGALLDQHSSVIEQQKWLEQNVLKMSYKTFVQIVILGSSAYIPFMQLTPSDRREVIEDLLDIKLFSSMNSLVKEKIREFKESVKILNLKKDSFEDRIKMQQDFIEQIEQRSRNDIEEKTNSISELFETIENLQKENESVTQSIEELNQQIESYSNVSDTIKKLLSSKTKLTVQAQNLKEIHTFFKTNDVCPTCSQQIDGEFKRAKQRQAKKELTELKDVYQNLLNDIQTETERQSTFQSLNDNLRTLNQKISYNNYQITQSQKRIKEFHDQINKITTDINNKNNEHTKLEEYISTLDETKTEIAEIKENTHYYEYVQLLLKDSGVKSKIIERYLRIINQQINKYLNLLELYVNFSLDSEFNEQITTPTFETFSYGNFSEGQKRRVDLALLFTWRYISSIKNSASTNLLICDEILDGSLDEMGHFSFLKIVKEEMRHCNTFVISHRDGIEHRFDNVISIEKQGNFTVKIEDS